MLILDFGFLAHAEAQRAERRFTTIMENIPQALISL
jgi:hypothetical protein